MNIIRENQRALIAFTSTLLLTLIGEFVLNLTPEGTYLTLAIGLIGTLNVALLENSLEKNVQMIGSKFEILNALSEINDVKLESQVIQIIDELSKGNVPHYFATLRSRELLEIVSHTIGASELAETKEGVYQFEENDRRKTWSDASLRAIERGVSVVQIFILKKEQIIVNGVWDTRTLKILKELARKGIDIRVLWMESLKPRRSVYPLIQDFAIYDGKEVVVEEADHSTRTYRGPSPRVPEYQRIIREQKKYARKLAVILAEQPSNEDTNH